MLENNYGTVLHNHDTLPLDLERVDLSIEEPLNETNPAVWSANRVRRNLQITPIDSLKLEKCHNLILLTPVDFLSALKSARETLEKDLPNIICAPFFGLDLMRELVRYLKSFKYQCWLDRLEGPSSEVYMMLALPEHVQVTAIGMQKIELKEDA